MADQHKKKVDTAEKKKSEAKSKSSKFECTQEMIDEWTLIDNLVMTYQKGQKKNNPTEEEVLESKAAADNLLSRFSPLFKKYILLLKSGQIDFEDAEQRAFIINFIDNSFLKRALYNSKSSKEERHTIFKKFNFVKETYGSLHEDEITIDLHLIFLNMANRYKQMGKSFQCYLYNSFRFEVARHIKKFTKNPLNIPYKNTTYEDFMTGINVDRSIPNEEHYEDHIYEDSVGMPDLTWISGQSCSEEFQNLSPLERKLLIKYYMEDWNDRQIAQEFGIHINTCNQKRRQAIAKIANALGIDEKFIKRNRKSGKKAIMPLNNVSGG